MEIKNTALVDRLLKIVIEIVNNSFCRSCKRYSNNIECTNCKEENKNLKKLFVELELILSEIKSLNQESKTIDLILYSLKNYPINNLLSFIKDFDINSFINKIVDKIQKNMNFDEEEIINLSILLKTKVINNSVINNFVILNCLYCKNFFDIDTIKSVICMFAETIYDAKKMNLICRVDNKNSHESLNENIIYLNHDEIERFMHGEMDVLFSLFHEYVHVEQYYRQVILQSSSVEDIKQIKERIIRKYNPKFFDDNKYVYSIEKEMNINGNMYLLKYLDSINFPMISYEDIKIIIDNDFKNDVANFKIVCEDNIMFDNEFNKVVKASDFNFFPQLKYEYKIKDSFVVSRNIDEIDNDIEYIKENFYYNIYDKKILIDIYEDIIQRHQFKLKNINY